MHLKHLPLNKNVEFKADFPKASINHVNLFNN